MGFLQENSGKCSAVRVCLLVSVLTACYIGIVGVHKGSDFVALSGLVGVYLGVPFVNKVWQKRSEK